MKLKTIAIMATALLIAAPMAEAKKEKPSKASKEQLAENGGSSRMERKKLDRSECMKESLKPKKDEFRAYGSGISPNRAMATKKATMAARAELAAQIENLTRDVADSYVGTRQIGGKRLHEEKDDRDLHTMVEHLLKGSRIICSDEYQLSDGTYEAEVCMSIPSVGVEEMGAALLMEKDSELKVDFDAENYRKSYQEALEEYRRMKAESE